MRINFNILSLSAQRALSQTTRALARSMERLASGRSINSARDDAAGLAIATGLESQGRGVTQTIRNMNDAQGFIQTTDGILAAQVDLIQRMRELAVQSANGTYAQKDRVLLNQEFQSLLEEFNRMTSSADFNGTKLLDGSFTTRSIQVGTNKGQTIALNLASTNMELVFGVTENIPTGTFGTSATLSTGLRPQSVNSADLNGDGNLDLLVAEQNSNTVGIYIGNGDGSFGARTALTVGTRPQFAIAADLNGDGKLDIVSADNGTGMNSIMLGNGNGSFQARTTIISATIPYNVIAVDLNNDGKLDLVTGDEGSATNSIHLGNGNGTFQARTTIGTGTNALTVTAADINEDGLLDLITGDYGTNTSSIFIGNGNGTFSTRTTIAAGNFAVSVKTADLNDDGNLDLMFANENSGTVSIAFGNGNGTFESRTTVATGIRLFNVIAADLNGDDILDLVTPNFDESTLSLHLGNGNGTFRARTTIPANIGAFNVIAVDINHDDILDLINSEFTNNSMSVRLGNYTRATYVPELSIETQADSEDMLEILDSALTYISTQRSNLGATQSRLAFAQSNALNMRENLASARSQMMETDYAEETAEFSRLQILQQAGIAVLGQANISMQMVLQLLNFRSAP